MFTLDSISSELISEVFRSILCIKSGQWPARLVVAEETEQMLMRTSQQENKENVI